ncbi:MAG: NADH-quinone oxidoreductase subunit H [Candidatus Omnitrophica bacterium]|nr:NADH-quinone oxidoreductase subunit H [Candidatus Omnitrophota bacterium]
MVTELLIKLALTAFFILGLVLNFAGLLTWVERKQSAIMQDRVGANRAIFQIHGWWARPINFVIRKIAGLGLLHPLADALKMMAKEDFIPAQGQRLLHTLAPFVSVFFALVTFAAIPFGDTLNVGGRAINLQIAKMDIGLLYILAMASLGIYGVFLAGVSSGNNYAYLGGVRAAAQMLAYEIAMGVSLLGILIWYGTLELQQMVRLQGGTWFGWIPRWGVFVQPVGFIIFLTAAIAETKRVPFDLPEGESEIIGYFVEYSGMKFGMFFLTDFVETVLVACLATTLFFGGWQVPYLYADGWHLPWGAAARLPHLAVVGLQLASFTFKVAGFLWLQMLIRWTLPRFRFDQLVRLGWKGLFPVSLANIVVTAIVVVALK